MPYEHLNSQNRAIIDFQLYIFPKNNAIVQELASWHQPVLLYTGPGSTRYLQTPHQPAYLRPGQRPVFYLGAYRSTGNRQFTAGRCGV